MPVTQTEMRLVFQRPPRVGFHAMRAREPEPMQLVVKLDPATGVRLLVEAQRGHTAEPEQISLDMEFAEEGGEGPTPYEVLLSAAMRGDSTRFTRQDGVEETWRIMQPLLDAPPPVHPYEKGSWGPAGGRPAVGRRRSLARAVGRLMSAVDDKAQTAPQSAAAPSPFPPIAQYAFLSDCHTGALIAPDGGIGWLCVPRFDAPSVFGSLLDRQAGYFRLAPFGINVPSSRRYEPGTNILETTWHTPSGWVVVRDALTMGPRRSEDTITPHTRPPTDDDAEHLLVRTVRCIDGNVEIELVCEPVFDYGRVPGEWALVGDDRHVADASGAEQTIRLSTDMALGIEGNTVRARHRSPRATSSTARCRGPRASPPRPTSTTPTRGWRRRRASGAAGSPAPGFPTTSG